jgi:hypothetical protein
MYLSLPLPESRVRQLVATLIAVDGSRPPTQVRWRAARAGAGPARRGA